MIEGECRVVLQMDLNERNVDNLGVATILRYREMGIGE